MHKFFSQRAQFLVFIIGGGVSALIDIGIMQWLIAQSLAYTFSTTAGFAGGLMINYLFHARLTFRTPATSNNLFRFVCVVAFNYAITLGCVAVAVAILPSTVKLSSLIGKIVSLPIVAINGFLLSKYWIFK